MNENIMRQAGFGKQLDMIKEGKCPTCGKDVGTFRDKLSKAEFDISGMCQRCQDEIFGIDPDDKFVDPDDPNVGLDDELEITKEIHEQCGVTSQCQFDSAVIVVACITVALLIILFGGM